MEGGVEANRRRVETASDRQQQFARFFVEPVEEGHLRALVATVTSV